MQINSFLSSLIALPLLGIVKFYQLFISPMLGQNCRFYPTCSCYAHQALTEHGAFRGSWLSIKRIMKCHPMHPGGIDNVPSADTSTTTKREKRNKKPIINSERNSTIKNHH